MKLVRKKILVVDDDPDIQDVTRVILESMGHHQVITSCKKELPGKLQDETPDLILLDIGLRGPDTEDFCKSIKSQEKTKNLPLLIFSTRMDVARNYQSIGADDFLPKPFEVNNLLEKVDRLMNSAPARWKVMNH